MARTLVERLFFGLASSLTVCLGLLGGVSRPVEDWDVARAAGPVAIWPYLLMPLVSGLAVFVVAPTLAWWLARLWRPHTAPNLLATYLVLPLAMLATLALHLVGVDPGELQLLALVFAAGVLMPGGRPAQRP